MGRNVAPPLQVSRVCCTKQLIQLFRNPHVLPIFGGGCLNAYFKNLCCQFVLPIYRRDPASWWALLRGVNTNSENRLLTLSRLCVCGFHWTDYHEIWNGGGTFTKICQKQLQILLKSGSSVGHRLLLISGSDVCIENASLCFHGNAFSIYLVIYKDLPSYHSLSYCSYIASAKASSPLCAI